MRRRNKKRRSAVFRLMGRTAGILALLAQLVNSCRGLLAPSVDWQRDVHSAAADAANRGKPLVVVFGADWDVASKELERETLVDPTVRTLLHDNFVSARVDCTDEDDPEVARLVRRYDVVGTPSVVVLAPDGVHERGRITSFVTPEAFAAVLRSADR